MRPSRALGRGLFGREARPYSSEQCTGTPPSRALEQGQAPAGWGWGGTPFLREAGPFRRRGKARILLPQMVLRVLSLILT